ncbi:hypothetical protein PDESU_01820 [Pontiella desulfatans]|uniref:Glycoside hydrolase family 42 N-terminal domain-containing protein n=1 Tax=Pontiella desulfatans TaxID=2750659 RepID=A0A6C2U0L2_PONDE|nr:hypothetical protein [Pontiella desulfatans]VGO13264.1 hypothetical protein PDESU_01820 [Pontiella desulfatans]
MKRIIITILCGMVGAGSVAAEPPGQRSLVFMRTHGKVLNEGNPATFTTDALKDIARHFPEYSHTNEISVGVGCIFSYLHHDLDTVEESLKRFLKASEKANVPVWIKLDGEQWWENRPDLWNWWDPTKPGYDPANVKNVERSHWSEEYALKIAWRDWGRQIRILPPPNLMSPTYREACHGAMDRLVPIVADWYNRLPRQKKGLFVGLNVGWESGVGTSSYYHPNGNELLGQPEANDPPGGSTVNLDVLSRGHQQIGYAAVSSAGLRSSGDITEDDLVEVIRLHLLDLSKKARELGIPKDKLYTHTFGNEKGEKLYDAAVNDLALPGWSEYWNSTDIMKNKGVLRNLHRPGVRQWGSVEWLLLYPVEKGQLWYTAIKNTINAPGLNMMCIYNWEIVDTPSSEVIRMTNKVLDEGLSPQELPEWTGAPISSLYDMDGE